MLLEILIFAYSWWIFSPDFKYVVLSHMNELVGISSMVGKIEMPSFHTNLNRKTKLHM
jgi:hypothetical protein